MADRYDRLHEMLRYHDAYNVDHHVESVLDGLGFRKDDYDRSVDTFSGGQQSRLILALLLLAAPDVMLLDEPSNHLDIGATRWLEDYLIKQPEAMLIVSHDRYFLNKVVTKVFEMSAKQIESYPGNYEAAFSKRRERHEQKIKTWEAQKDYIEKQEEYIRRVHYGQLHKQAASRQKQIDKIERIERPVWIDTPRMHFGEVRRTGDIVLDVEGLSKAYDRPLFKDLTFMLKRGQRLGMMGPNGCGKTTLLKIMLGQEKADAGTVTQGHLVEFGYYDQHLKALDGSKNVMRAVWPSDDANEQAMRDLLGRFGLTGDQVYQVVDKLSGGERSRAALAKLVADGVNVLILDEPTNHLDLWACDALEQLLLDFDGHRHRRQSHDCYFLNRVVDLLLVFEGDGVVRIIYGNYDMYERMRLLQAAGARIEKKETQKAQMERPASRRPQAAISVSQSRGPRSGDRRRGDARPGIRKNAGVAGTVSRRGQGAGDHAGVRGCQGQAQATLRSLGGSHRAERLIQGATSFPGSAWERTTARLCLADQNCCSSLGPLKRGRASRMCARSQAERGNRVGRKRRLRIVRKRFIFPRVTAFLRAKKTARKNPGRMLDKAKKLY